MALGATIRQGRGLSKAFAVAQLGVLALALSVLSGCSSREENSELKSAAATFPSHHLVVVSGGFSSCITGLHGPYSISMYEPAQSMVLALKRHPEVRQVRFLISCFGQSNQKIRFAHGFEGGRTNYGDKEDFYQAILEELFPMPTNHAIHFVGHSYGGSLTMEMASRLPSWANVQTVATLDPISRSNCAPQYFVRAYTRSMFTFNPHWGCTEAPRDWQHTFLTLQNRSQNWVHAYQTQYGYLHSGPVYRADRSFERSYRTNFITAFRAHTEIAYDELVWGQIIAGAVPGNPSPPTIIARNTK